MNYTITTIYRANTPTGYAEFRNEAEAQAYLAEVQAADEAVLIEAQPTNEGE
jgi:hypothetical protein